MVQYRIKINVGPAVLNKRWVVTKLHYSQSYTCVYLCRDDLSLMTVVTPASRVTQQVLETGPQSDRGQPHLLWRRAASPEHSDPC